MIAEQFFIFIKDCGKIRKKLQIAIMPKREDKYVEIVFNSTELHFSEVYFFQNWYFSAATFCVSGKPMINETCLKGPMIYGEGFPCSSVCM